MSFELREMNELIGALKKRANLDDVKKAVQINSAEMQNSMMRSAPVDTGYLKRSIELNMSDGGFTGKVTPTAHYAPYLIYGTRYMYARDFFRPNFYRQRDKFINDMKRLMR